MTYAIKRFLLTPSEAAAKALIVEQIRMNTRGPWGKGKKMSLPTVKGTTSSSKKKT